MKRILSLSIIALLYSCGSSESSPEFIEQVTGNYLFNSDESIEIHFIDNQLSVKWRGRDDIKPLKVNDSTFYMKELNEKIVFVSKPITHIILAPKREHEGKKYHFKKLAKGEKTPSEYLRNNEFDKALAGYLAIQQRDSLDRTIRERTLNSLGYQALRAKKHQNAIAIFKINTTLYPASSNTFDSLGEAYWQLKDTVNAVSNYKKALSINPENRKAKRFLKKHKLN
ncbi:MAG: hypothetical protein P8K77_07130 [Polaribacter sp.]|nr:hypothetical protein [Polaribacter sp.]